MYLQLISIHGLVRGKNVEMGRDADTGGQVRYVIELAKTLSKFEGIDQVDLFTRRIKDDRVSPEYAEPIEELTDNCRIVRLPCGPSRYIRKEKLWPYLDEFVDQMIAFSRKEGREPAIVHGHYADAGYVGREVASVFGVPFVFTGHSLGKPKLDYLLSEGWTTEQTNKELSMDHRIGVEQDCLSAADLVITSTKHERDDQYKDYHRRDDLPFAVIPPGTDLDRFFPYYDYDIPGTEIGEEFKQARVRMQHELGRFFTNPDKPLILALCRPDRRKNIGALIEAYGQSNELRAIANLAVFAGIRKDIEDMPDNEKEVLTDMLMAMDRFDLYGRLAIPKNHDSEFDVPELYRLAACSRGVFVNSAFIELFGLTAIEAAATGLPFVAPKSGGPTDIVENCESGYAVDTTNQEELTSAILKLLTDENNWNDYSANGVNRVREHYSWETHCENYMAAIKSFVVDEDSATAYETSKHVAPAKRLGSLDAILVTDIDNTLVGDDASMHELLAYLQESRDRVGFAVASGRSRELVDEIFAEHDITNCDMMITSVGTEIYYRTPSGWQPDKGWASRLREKWKPDRIRDVLDQIPFLNMQTDPTAQREFKISYDLADTVEDSEAAIQEVRAHLNTAKLAYSLIFSHGSFVDILPIRASKGKAIRHLAHKWNMPIERFITAGDSGNDRDMLAGRTSGIVVGNHSDELASLKPTKATRVYFANAHYAAGIMEGLAHYKVTESAAAMEAV